MRKEVNRFLKEGGVYPAICHGCVLCQTGNGHTDWQYTRAMIQKPLHPRAAAAREQHNQATSRRPPRKPPR